MPNSGVVARFEILTYPSTLRFQLSAMIVEYL